MQKSALCRSRRELSNANLLAKFGFDTAENEPIRLLQCSWTRPISGAMTLDEKGIDVPNGQATCMADFAKSAWLENLGTHPFDTLSTNDIETSSADFWKEFNYSCAIQIN